MTTVPKLIKATFDFSKTSPEQLLAQGYAIVKAMTGNVNFTTVRSISVFSRRRWTPTPFPLERQRMAAEKPSRYVTNRARSDPDVAGPRNLRRTQLQG